MNNITQAYAIERLRYDDGDLYWKKIEENNYQDKRWNTRFAGKKAGTTNMNGYRNISITKNKICKVLKEHRIVFLIHHGFIPNEIDHINRDKADNRIENLRSVSHEENHKNQKIPKHNKSGVMGVCWLKQNKKWAAIITVNFKQIRLGYTNDFFEAVCLRKSAELKHGFHPNHGRTPA